MLSLLPQRVSCEDLTKRLFLEPSKDSLFLFSGLMFFCVCGMMKAKEDRKRRTMKTVTVYTDGACSGNPGPGGWGAVLVYNGKEKELSGGDASTTNNRMELTAAICALEALKEPCRVELYSDSKYLVDAIEKKWLEQWVKRGWKKADKSPVLNPDLWQRLLEASRPHQVIYHWVKGHAGHAYNERCDQLAVAQAEAHSR